MTILKVFLANLSAYNRGDLIGEWVTLPVDEDELKETIDHVLAQGEPNDEEYFITDYESDFFGRIGEYDNIDELNEMSERIQDAVEYHGKEAVIAIIRDMYTLPEAVDVLNSSDFSVLYDVYDVYDLGIVYVQDGFFGDVPEHVERYFDYEALGRDLTYEGWTIHSDLGIAVYYE